MPHDENTAARERRAQDSRRRGDRGPVRAVLACACVCLTASGRAAPAPAPTAAGAASTPGAVLRQYLQARTRGDLEAARALWDPRDLRRSTAMAIRYDGVAGGFDDYWFLDAEAERKLAAAVVPVVRDSVVEQDWVGFTVFLRDKSSGAVRDTLAYAVGNDGGTWRVTLPYLQATRAWTRREGRYFRLRAKRLVDVSTQAMQAADNAIARAFTELGTPEAAQLRLERVKLEYFLCDDEADVRALVGTVRRAGYLPGGERVVARVLPNLNAVARLLVNLTLRTAPPRNVPWVEEGLAAALGGTDDISAEVLIQRARDVVARDPTRLGAPFAAGAASDSVTAWMSALWCKALLQELTPGGFVDLVRGLGGTAAQVAARTPAAVRAAIETASGKKGAALDDAVRQRIEAFSPPLRAGCTSWPTDTRGLQPVLNWRDKNEQWGVLGYETGDDYTITVAAYEAGPPRWMRAMLDSLSEHYGAEQQEWDTKPAPRPLGDPPRITLLVRARMEEDLEPYESALFAQHFLARDYKNDLFGLFITPDDARLYDYRQNKLVGEYSAKTAPPGGLVYFDEKSGHICFRFRRDLFPRPLTAYYVFVSIYTGE